MNFLMNDCNFQPIQAIATSLCFRRNRSCSASDSAYSYTFLSSVVCLSVVCLSHSAPCLNRSTNLDAAWQVHLRGRMTWCQIGFPAKEICGSKPQPKHAIANCSQTVSPMQCSRIRILRFFFRFQKKTRLFTFF